MNLISFLVPQDKKFFPLFEKASANLVNIAKCLNETVLIQDSEKRNDKIREIEKMEHLGDQITHDIYNELGKTFITPF